MAHFELLEEQLQQSPVHTKAPNHMSSLRKVSQLTACVIPVTTEGKKKNVQEENRWCGLFVRSGQCLSIVFPVLDIQ